MITKRPSHERGHADHGWLDTRHTFSFGRYYDPRYTGFRDLLVINEDRVQPSRGFGTHSHDNMEIISYVLEGLVYRHAVRAFRPRYRLPRPRRRASLATPVSRTFRDARHLPA